MPEKSVVVFMIFPRTIFQNKKKLDATPTHNTSLLYRHTIQAYHTDTQCNLKNNAGLQLQQTFGMGLFKTTVGITVTALIMWELLMKNKENHCTGTVL